MKLVDLNPRWGSEKGRHGQAVNFDCPACTLTGTLDTCTWGMSIPFANPLDGGPPLAGARTLWERHGDTFETLTLSPSVHAVGHWHGWIRDGVVSAC